jgi:succinate-acetate transporter protein
MFVNTKWTESEFVSLVVPTAMVYGGAVQLIAGVLEMCRGNVFAGTAFSSYGAFWMSWFILNVGVAQGWLTSPSEYPIGLEMWFGIWGVLSFGFLIGACRKNVCLVIVFFLLVITFGLLAGGVRSDRTNKVAGYFGFFCGATALYAGFADLLNELYGFPLCPGVAPLVRSPTSSKT